MEKRKRQESTSTTSGNQTKQADSGSGKKAAQSPELKTVFVGGLAFGITKENVVDFFKNAGEIVDFHFGFVDGIQKSCSLVEFDTVEAAKKALELHGKFLLGRQVRVEFAREEASYMALFREA